MITAFTSYNIVPGYAAGFGHNWDISAGLADPAPWVFVVEESESPSGPWEVISPEQVNVFSWDEDNKRLVSKDRVLYFRVKLTTSVGTYYSDIIQPYGDLSRREFLIAREVIRQEVLHQRTMAGVLCKLYVKSTTGPLCEACIDPITKKPRDSHCDTCLGTGRTPPYHGPYDVWCMFTPMKSDTRQKPGGNGMDHDRAFSVRSVAVPPMKTEDAIYDSAHGKFYYVESGSAVAELRRVPVIQQAIAHEAPTSDAIYEIIA